MDPTFVQFATGFGAKRVNRLDVSVPATLPYQFPVELSVYEAFRFMKRPVVAGIRLVVWTVPIFAVTMFDTVETRFVVRLTRLEMETTLSVPTFAVVAVRPVSVPTDVMFGWAG